MQILVGTSTSLQSVIAHTSCFSSRRNGLDVRINNDQRAEP